MTLPVRKFKYPDVVCLDTSDTMVDNAVDNYQVIVEKRPALKDPFLPGIKSQIQTAYSKYLGIDNAKELRNATAAVHTLQSQSLQSISDFKADIEFIYSSDIAKRNEILTTLGIKSLYRSVSYGNQEALVELLNKFSANMTPELEAEVTANGAKADNITTIKNNAVPFQLANKTQEQAKGKRQVNTAEGINALNDIYTKVTSFGKLVRKDFKDNPAMQKLFTFSVIAKAIMNNRNNSGTNNNPPDNPTPPAN